MLIRIPTSLLLSELLLLTGHVCLAQQGSLVAVPVSSYYNEEWGYLTKFVPLNQEKVGGQPPVAGYALTRISNQVFSLFPEAVKPEVDTIGSNSLDTSPENPQTSQELVQNNLVVQQKEDSPEKGTGSIELVRVSMDGDPEPPAKSIVKRQISLRGGARPTGDFSAWEVYERLRSAQIFPDRNEVAVNPIERSKREVATKDAENKLIRGREKRETAEEEADDKDKRSPKGNNHEPKVTSWSTSGAGVEGRRKRSVDSTGEYHNPSGQEVFVMNLDR